MVLRRWSQGVRKRLLLVYHVGGPPAKVRVEETKEAHSRRPLRQRQQARRNQVTNNNSQLDRALD